MAWRIVQQPNGLFAIFSDVVDGFTVFDMTEAEAALECVDQLSDGVTEAARKKVAAAIESGIDRWNESILTIAAIHGADVAERILTDVGEGE